MDSDALQSWLVRFIAGTVGVDPRAVDAREPFTRLGLDSLAATRLVNGLSEALGRPLEPTIVWEHPTIEALVRHLIHGDARTPFSTPGQGRAPGAHEEAIAIVGMACRFPKAPDPRSFWRLLVEGVDAITEVPPDRRSAGAPPRWGGFLEQVDGFDPQFFGISPREAVQMDPQQRLALELSWEALEDAGIPPHDVRCSATGVFLGAIFNEYAILQHRAGPEAITAHTSTGGASCIIANRVSYSLGLMGPSMTIETACSSSLVAVHLACHSLRRGETDLALAGGVNLLLLPETTVGFEKLGAMSPHGRCMAFDASGSGYVRSEGAGVVVLKRLSDALRSGDRIYCTIRGSAVNNDGPSNGLTAPNPAAQRALLASACQDAGVDPASVHYVEAHGTGTPLGDPIEASALGAVYGAARSPERSLRIGSVKTNVGHLEAAAGIAGLIKTALAMRHGAIPPSLHFQRPNPRIDFDALRLRVVTQLEPWPTNGVTPRRAGVSSFGYGGTSAHVVLESLPDALEEREAPAATAPIKPRRVAWLFSGQGSQWVGMGRELILGEPVFRTALLRCDAAIRAHTSLSVFDELLLGAPRALPERIDVLWPVLFAFQVALADLWRSFGVDPAVIVGHSIGEVAAAHVAGALDLEDAARVICSQAALVQRTVGKGAMVFVSLGWSDAQALVAPYGDRLSCAIAASPVGTVLSGELGALDEVLGRLRAAGIFTRSVATGAAVHAGQMDEVARALLPRLDALRPRRASTPLVSATTGDPVQGEELGAAYWARQIREPVRFDLAIDRILAATPSMMFIELAPHPIVKRSVEECIDARGSKAESRVIASLSRSEPAAGALEAARGALVRFGAIPRRAETDSSPPRAYLLPLSARSPEALSALARSFQAFLAQGPGAKAHLHGIAFMSSARRSHHDHRLALVGQSAAECASALEAFSSGEMNAGVVTGRALPTATKVVFVFPGQGSQWLGMGQTLLRDEPVFRDVLVACDRAIRDEAGFSVLEELAADEARSRLGEIDVVQPVLFAIEVALAALWRSWGIEPAAVVGHSMGEVAAAHVAGALSLEDAAAVICRRSRLLRKMSGKGAMALVELAMDEVEEALVGHEARLSVAASNGPRATVVAGDPAALEEVLARLEARGVFCRRVKVDVASHSPQMDPLLPDLLGALSGLSPRQARVPMRSTVTGELLHGGDLSAAYWADNLRKPVLFSRVVERWIEEGHTLFVEMSPHPILLTSVEENLRGASAEGTAVASLRRGQPERASLLLSLGSLYVHGHAVDGRRLYAEGGRFVELPAYPWQRERYWITPAGRDEGPSREARRAARGTRGHPLLGTPFDLSLHPGERFWELPLSVASLPYVTDHRVQGDVVFPGAGYVEMALAAGGSQLGAASIGLEDVVFEQMLALPERGERLVQVALVDEGAGRSSFQIASRAPGDEGWMRHARGSVRSPGGGAPSMGALEHPRVIAERLGRPLSAAEHYDRMRQRNLDYGPAFQGLIELWARDQEALGRIELPADVDDEGHWLHPTLLDACFQVAVGLARRSAARDTYVPVGIARMQVHARPGREAWVVVKKRAAEEADELEFASELRVLDAEGRILVDIEGLRLRRLSASASGAEDALGDCVYDVAWRRGAPLPEAKLRSPGTWLVFADRGGLAAQVKARLLAHDQRCVRVVAGASYAGIEPDLYQVDTSQPQDYQRLLRDVFGNEGRCPGVVHLSGLDAAPFEETTEESLWADLRAGSLSATYLAQALVRHAFRDAPRLFLVTRGAQAVLEGEPVSVSQAPAWGLGKTLALEHPELRCTRIDLDSAACAEDAELLVRELLSADREEQIALRGDGRHVPRVVRGRLEPIRAHAFTLRADASYLITGGLGGLGLELSRWLVEKGARHLVLVGRRGPGEEALRAIRALEEAGARVEYARADAASRGDLERVLSTLEGRLPPLRGVVHAAGVLDDRTLLEQSEEHFRNAFAPKALGAWNLHVLTQGEELDFFVMYSSAMALFGSPGQANYTAANAFLDALSRARVRAGRPSLSIQWGPFAQVGLAAAQGIRGERLSRRGMTSLEPSEGHAALERLLLRPRPEVAVVRFDVRHWGQFYPRAAAMPFLSELTKESSGARGDGGEGARVRQMLIEATPPERLPLLMRHLREQLGSVLRLDPSRIDPRTPLSSLGMDSLMSLELRNRLEASLALRLSATLLFTYPTTVSLSEYLLDRLDVPPPPAREPPPAAPEEPGPELSDEEVLRALQESIDLAGSL